MARLTINDFRKAHAMRDMFNNINVLPVINPAQNGSTNTAIVGAIIDRQGYNALTYIIQYGSISDADATFTTLLEEGDAAALGDASAVADADLLGTEVLATPLFSDDNKVFKLGYTGNKRYTRLTITPAANTGDVYCSSIALLGEPDHVPTVNPPA